MKILFLGDSITEGFNTSRLLPQYNITNKGVSGNNTEDTLKLLNDNFFSEILFNYIFLCIGTNDIAQGKNDEEIIGNVQLIIAKLNEIQHGAKIILLPLFPTLNNEPRPNERIVGLNKKFNELAIKNDLMFFNLHPHFITNNGELKEEYSLDGLHLRKLAYKKWASLFDEFMNNLIY